MKFLVCDMRNNERIVLGVLILLCAGCFSSSSISQNARHKTVPETCELNATLFDCGASSLYGLCTRSGINISYDDCVRLLPKSSKGNNMLEFKNALQHLGFNVRAEQFSADQSGDLNLPCIVLLMPSGINAIGRPPGTIGHYLVLWPADAEKVEIIDYPRPPVIISRNYWGKHLQTVGIKTIPVLICDWQKQR